MSPTSGILFLELFFMTDYTDAPALLCLQMPSPQLSDAVPSEEAEPTSLNGLSLEQRTLLINAYKIDLFIDSTFEGFDTAVEFILPKLQLDGRRNLNRLMLRFLLVALAKQEQRAPFGYTSIPRDHSAWSFKQTSRKRNIYNPHGISKRIVRVLDALMEKGWLEQRIGYKKVVGNSNCQGYLTRIRPSQKLRQLLIDANLTKAVFFRHADSALIVLKDRNKKPIGYNFKEVEAMAESVRRYNNFMSNVPITINEPALTASLCLNIKSVYRVFNETFDRGGRFFGGWWQYLPKGERGKILIDGCKTVELDYEAQCLNFLYSYSGLAYDCRNGDPYAMEGYDRKLIKKVILTAINADSLYKARIALREEFQKADLSSFLTFVQSEAAFRHLLDSICAKHPPLSQHLFTGIGLKVMNDDALICDTVHSILVGQGIPVLSIFDSFIVKEKDADQLREAMKNAYVLNGLEHALPSIK